MITADILEKLTDEQIREQFDVALSSCKTHLVNATDADNNYAKMQHINNALNDLKDITAIAKYSRKPWWKFWK